MLKGYKTAGFIRNVRSIHQTKNDVCNGFVLLLLFFFGGRGGWEGRGGGGGAGVLTLFLCSGMAILLGS